VLITVGNVWARIAQYTPDELAFVKGYLSYRTVNHRGKTKQSSVLTKDYFPAGLARRLARAAREASINVELVSKQSTVAIIEGYGIEGVNWTPRQHQVEALDAIRKYRRGLIQHATGAGKSDLIGLLANLIQGKVLIVATSKKLREDLVGRVRKFAALSVDISKKPARAEQKTQHVFVVNDDALKNLSDAEMASFDAVLCDEAHHVASPTHQAALKRCKNAAIRIGFSATALNRADRKSLFTVGMLGETLHRYTPAQAAEAGVIAKAVLRMPQYAHTNMQDCADYAEWERVNIAQNTARNLAVLRLVHSTKAPRIVFVRTKLHQQELVRMIKDCVYVNDETDAQTANNDLTKLRNGLVDTLVSTPIYRQGVDIPEIATVINAAGGKATIDVIQKVGRGSRIRQVDGSTKDTFEVYDICDTDCGCEGELHRGCKWVREHSTSRRKAYEEFGYRVRSE